MKLVVGLGNVGSEYALTRHNLGFLTVDELATRHNTSWKTEGKLYADVTSFQLGDEKVILAKPDTYMNNSGKAVTALMHYYKIEVSDVWVVSDDLDLAFGKVRLRIGGSSGGHNGLKSIIGSIGAEFVRLRAGIRAEHPGKIEAIDYVLQKFSTDEQKELPHIIQQAVEILETGLVEGPSAVSATIQSEN